VAEDQAEHPSCGKHEENEKELNAQWAQELTIPRGPSGTLTARPEHTDPGLQTSPDYPSLFLPPLVQNLRIQKEIKTKISS
jgi:hypothetical protein